MLKRIFVLFLVSAFFLSCEEDEMSMELTKLEKQKLVWQLNRPANYSYKIFKTCLCPAVERGPYKVTVKNFQVSEIKYIGAKALTQQDYQSMPLINANLQLDSLFSTMQLNFLKKPDKVLIDYNPEYGFPAEVSIDFERNSTDDEVGFFVSNFELLELPK